MLEIISQINDLIKRVGKLESLETPFKSYGLWANRPTAPFSGQRYFATDRNIEYVWDGTRWLSPKIWLSFNSRGATMPFAQGTTFFDAVLGGKSTGSGVLITDLQAEARFISVVQSGTNFYTISLVVTNGTTVTTVPLSGTTDTKTFGTNHQDLTPTVTPTAVDQTFFLVEATMTPTANPGTFIFFATLGYRLIG